MRKSLAQEWPLPLLELLELPLPVGLVLLLVVLLLLEEVEAALEHHLRSLFLIPWQLRVPGRRLSRLTP
jgi:hypothetical protein